LILDPAEINRCEDGFSDIFTLDGAHNFGNAMDQEYFSIPAQAGVSKLEGHVVAFGAQVTPVG
jgi:hypothetical protein